MCSNQQTGIIMKSTATGGGNLPKSVGKFSIALAKFFAYVIKK